MARQTRAAARRSGLAVLGWAGAVTAGVWCVALAIDFLPGPVLMLLAVVLPAASGTALLWWSSRLSTGGPVADDRVVGRAS